MDNLSFGLTLLVLGMGGTLLVLALFVAVIKVLVRWLPIRPEKPEEPPP